MDIEDIQRKILKECLELIILKSVDRRSLIDLIE